jgi:hypothetical protein
MSAIPPKYKSLNQLYTVSKQYESRDLPTAYWARLHCVQEAMKIDSKDKAGRIWLSKLKHAKKDYENFSPFRNFFNENGLPNGAPWG